ncbi:MAG: NAD(P)H-binding protein [Actinomycetota bacterium]|nr:NAD(P)H-binding protein [Actinomycetota bacterium]
MRVVIAGANGRVGRRLGRLLVARGDRVVGIVRKAEHEEALSSAGVEPVVLDLEQATVDQVAAIVVDNDVVVFAAGTRLGNEADVGRKDAVDRSAAILLADAAGAAAVRRYVMMSSMGVETLGGDGPLPGGLDELYLRAKRAAEEGVRARPVVDLTVLRPGRLTDEPGTGRVTLARSAPFGSVSRDDVAAVLLALLDSPVPGVTLEVVAGETPVAEAVSTAVTAAA